MAEQFTGLEGRYVKLEDTLRSFETSWAASWTSIQRPPQQRGNVDEVIAKAKKMGAV